MALWTPFIGVIDEETWYREGKQALEMFLAGHAEGMHCIMVYGQPKLIAYAPGYGREVSAYLRRKKVSERLAINVGATTTPDFIEVCPGCGAIGYFFDPMSGPEAAEATEWVVEHQAHGYDVLVQP